MVIRPAQHTDLEDILALAASAGTGLTTLPNDPVRIEDKIKNSVDAFSRDIVEPGPEYYFLCWKMMQLARLLVLVPWSPP